MPLLAGAADISRMGLMLNKRLLRIAIASAVFGVISGFLLLRQYHFERARRPLPITRKHTGPDAYLYPSTSHFSPVTIEDAASASSDDLCASFPRYLLNYIQPVLKIGHSENRERLSAHFETTSSCFTRDELLVMSDLDEVVHGHRTIDVLADLPAAYYDLDRNPHFQNYLWQKEMRRNGTLNDQTQKLIDGWILDKYKFLPMVERAWLARPGKAFYIFYEPDTYVFWDNLFRFLERFDPEMPIYMGSPSPGRLDIERDMVTWFGNGGPGLVLSRGAIQALLHRRTDDNGHYVDPPLAEKWQDLVAGECCGDSALGWALWNITIQLQGFWPMFNPHPLAGIPFSDSYWCQPVLTLHKTAPKDAVDLWHWEFSQRDLHRPMLYSDVWRLQHPGEPSVLDDWDNGGWDGWEVPEEALVNSFETCGDFCHKDDTCFQWTWHHGDEKKCVLVRSIRFGATRTPEKLPIDEDQEAAAAAAARTRLIHEETGVERTVKFRSGWVQSRIQDWRNTHTCETVQWLGPSVTRIF